MCTTNTWGWDAGKPMWRDLATNPNVFKQKSGKTLQVSLDSQIAYVVEVTEQKIGLWRIEQDSVMKKVAYAKKLNVLCLWLRMLLRMWRKKNAIGLSNWAKLQGEDFFLSHVLIYEPSLANLSTRLYSAQLILKEAKCIFSIKPHECVTFKGTMMLCKKVVKRCSLEDISANKNDRNMFGVPK